MNERIKQLAKQANIEFTYDPTETPMRAFAECWDDELEKFAELIVQECIAICQDTDGEDNIDARSGRHDCAVEIQDHFGVEP
jgi:hypothetical protein